MFEKSMKAGQRGHLTDPHLWNRIRIAPLPTTRDGREFARALALADDLPFSEARDVEQEYRRYLYLCAISDAPRVAPPQVRLAWQMHAQAPEYVAFCQGVLGKLMPLDDTTRMLGATGAYRRTRADYLREFGEKPPRLYWPEGVAPRMPRWLTAHAAILGFSGAVAWGQQNLLILAAGVGAALLLYGLDLYSAQLLRSRKVLGDTVSADLTHFLEQNAQR